MEQISWVTATIQRSLPRRTCNYPRYRIYIYIYIMRHLFVVDSLDKQMQNEKEPIYLASAGVGGLFFIFVGEY